jgi:2-amino-4-hydroxy-6-hydroxymethyldihydropteridine diphosphokinase
MKIDQAMGIDEEAAQRNGNLQILTAGLGGSRGPIVIALGSNLGGKAGKPPQVLKAALRALARSGIRIRRVSSFYRNPAVPASAQPPFVNAVALVETTLPPDRLMAALHRIERRFGRTRRRRNAARVLDLDLIAYHGRIEPGGPGQPTLPHPRAAGRAFVMVPLMELVPGLWRRSD